MSRHIASCLDKANVVWVRSFVQLQQRWFSSPQHKFADRNCALDPEVVYAIYNLLCMLWRYAVSTTCRLLLADVMCISTHHGPVINRERTDKTWQNFNLKHYDYSDMTVMMSDDDHNIKWYAVTLQPATLRLINSAATTALGFPTSDFLHTSSHLVILRKHNRLLAEQLVW